MNRIINSILFLVLTESASAQFVSVQDAIDMALEKNYDIRVQRATTELALNDNRFAFGAFLPQLSATGGYLKSATDSRNVTFANVETIRKGVRASNTSGTLQLLWPIFDGTRMFATRKRVAELAALGEVNVRNQMMNSVAAVITSYYGIVRQKQQLKALQELILVNEERVRLAEKKFQVGTGGKPELLQAKVDYNNNRVLAVQQETLIQQQKDQLNGLLGMGLPSVFEIADTIPINLMITLDDVLTSLDASNQQLKAARKNVDIASATLWQTRASRSPVISLQSAYNYNKTENSLATSPFALQYLRSNGYNYGLTVSVPILTNLNTTRLISAAKIDLGRQQTIYHQVKTQVTVAVRNAFVAYDNAKKILELEEQNILLARENVSIALETFRRGNITFIELRTAQQTLADTYAALILARFNAKSAETELLRLKGDLLK